MCVVLFYYRSFAVWRQIIVMHTQYINFDTFGFWRSQSKLYYWAQGLFPAAEHQEFAQGGQERDDDDAQDDGNEIMVYVGNGVAQEIADA